MPREPAKTARQRESNNRATRKYKAKKRAEAALARQREREQASAATGFALISRAEAIAQGLRFYFTGRPCERAGHLVQQHVVSRNCVACESARSKSTKTRARKKVYWHAHKDELLARKAEYRRREGAVAHAAAYYAGWAKANPHKVNAKNAKRRAGELQRTPVWADLEALEAVYWVRDQLQKEHGTKFEVDHVIPLRGKLVSGLHVPYNLQIIPAAANSKKHNRFSDESSDPIDRAHRAARNSIVGKRAEDLIRQDS